MFVCTQDLRSHTVHDDFGQETGNGGKQLLKKVVVNIFIVSYFYFFNYSDSRPTSFVREMAEFRCDNGHGFLSPVMVPTTCSCVPCDEIEYKPTWSNDTMWNTTEREHIITEEIERRMKLWGEHDID